MLRFTELNTRRVSSVGVAAAMGLAMWITWPAWQPGMLLTMDGPRHVLRATVMREMLIEQGRIDGWSPYWHLGVAQFQFQSYGYYLLQTLAGLIPWGSAAQPVSDKLAVVVPIVLLPLAVYWLATHLGVTRLGAVVAAFASIFFRTETGYGMNAAFAVGLELHTVGILLVAVTLPLLADPPAFGERRFYGTALLVGITLLVHFISGAYLVIAGGVLSFLAARSARRVRLLVRGLGVVALAVLLAGHALFPALELRETIGASVGWGWTDRAAQIVLGRHFGPWPLLLLAILGWGMVVRSGPRVLQRVAVLGIGTFLVAAAPPLSLKPELMGSLVRSVVQPRSLAFVCLLLPVFVGYAIESGFSAVVAGSLRSGSVSQRILAAFVAVLTVATISAIPRDLGRLRGMVRTEATRTGAKTELCRSIIDWLRDHGRPGSIVAYEPKVLGRNECGTPSIASLINIKTGLYTLGGDQAELTRIRRTASFSPATVAQSYPKGLEHKVTRYRVSYLLVRSPKIREKLHRVSGLRIAFENDPVTIFEATSPRRVLQANRIEILEKNLHTTSAAWVVRNHTKKPRSALVAISYHPAWQAYVDGHPTTISPTSDALIRIAIPSGIHALQLRYERRPIERLYYGLSLLALLVIAGGLIHRTEQRECRRTRTG